jgi:hypothetical protein
VRFLLLEEKLAGIKVQSRAVLKSSRDFSQPNLLLNRSAEVNGRLKAAGHRYSWSNESCEHSMGRSALRFSWYFGCVRTSDVSLSPGLPMPS